jgi:hypothetical protein
MALPQLFIYLFIFALLVTHKATCSLTHL